MNDIVAEGTPIQKIIEKDYQLLGAVQTKDSFQSVVIHPKKLIHRIYSLFNSTPPSLKGYQKYRKKLSTYYKNENDVLKLMEKGVFDEIMKLPRYTIEIHDQWLVVNTKEKFNLENGNMLIAFLMKIYEKGL